MKKLNQLLNKLPLLIAFGAIGWAIWPKAESRDRAVDVVNNVFRGNGGQLCTVKPGSVYDGDTLRVLCDRSELKIRMCGIDAPEKDQPGGIEARDYLRSLLPDGAEVVVIPVEEDRYGRTVAEIWNDANSEQFVNGAMVLAGRAWHYEQYSGSCPNKEAIATAAQIGEKPQGEPPWDFRRKNRK
jgi:endonuclease YncB( thermonuclease family)